MLGGRGGHLDRGSDAEQCSCSGQGWGVNPDRGSDAVNNARARGRVGRVTPIYGSDAVNGVRARFRPRALAHRGGSSPFLPLKTLSNHLNGNYGKDWSELGPF